MLGRLCATMRRWHATWQQRCVQHALDLRIRATLRQGMRRIAAAETCTERERRQGCR